VYNPRAGVIYGRRLYEGSFFAIECSTSRVISQVPLWAPNFIVYDSVDNKAYCTFTSHGEDSVLVVDGSTHSRVRAVAVPGATRPIWGCVQYFC
jgi:hypothetical protein